MPLRVIGDGRLGPVPELERELLDVLACPKCKGELRYLPDQDALDCLACRLRYRVEDGIPVMLVGEATALPDPASP
jgi:uncharacterized protein YbaR (Trm112 family)